MTLLTAAGSGSSILSPEDVQALVIQPLIRDSIATQISTIVQTQSHETRFPIVQEDPVTNWTAESAEITISQPDLDELVVTPKKLAGLTPISNELAADSDPSALEVVGSGLVRDLQTRLDAAYFGVSVADGPNGLGSLSGVQHVDAGSTLVDLDCFAEAQALAENVGSTITAFVGSPDTVLSIVQLKSATGWATPLLSSDPTSPTKRSVFGVPLYSSAAVADDVIWAVPKSKSFVVLRLPATTVVDSSVFFTSDRVAVRCTLRAAFGWPHAAGVVRIDLSGS